MREIALGTLKVERPLYWTKLQYMVDPAQNTKHLMAALENCPLIPVLTISQNDLIDPLGSILFNSRVQAIEVTLRSPCALEAINIIKKSYPQLLIGAGTILNVQQLELAQAAGADFLVTPGTPLVLLKKLRDADLPIIPGASSPTEMMLLNDEGFQAQKFFPAEALGGPDFLNSISGPLPHLEFCPTGGVSRSNVRDYLRLKNVFAVGGGWLVNMRAAEKGEWEKVASELNSALEEEEV